MTPPVGISMYAVLAGLLAAWAPASQAAESSLSFTHHDWMLVCDNTRTCRAAGYQDEYADNEPVSVLLTREAGAGARVTARVMVGQYDDGVLPRTLAMRIDDRDFGPLRLDGDGATAGLAPPQVAGLLEALTRDSEILFLGDEEGQRWALSDRGATAVLLKMDEFQGRLGTPGALVRRGNRSEADLPPPVPAPIIRMASVTGLHPDDGQLTADPRLRSALMETLPEDEECTGLEAGEQEVPMEVARLDSDTMLVSVRCWRAAYNEGYGYWTVGEQAPYEPRLVTTSASYHENGIIGASQKGRGLGDCGWHASWIWDGRQFVQDSELTTGMCRLVAAGGAWQLPTLVREVVTAAIGASGPL